MTPEKLSALFNQFAGLIIPMVEKLDTFTFNGATYNEISAELANKNDPVIAHMQDVAKDNGLRLRLWLPNTMGTMDYRQDRVNVYVTKEADGKYRVSSTFRIG